MISLLCSPTDASVMCQDRHDAVRDGDFYWEFSRAGWIWVGAPLRQVTARTWWFLVENDIKNYIDHSGCPYLLEMCPWCRAELPEVAPATLCQSEGEE